MVLESIHGGFSETVAFNILLEIPDFPAEFPDGNEYRNSEEDKNRTKSKSEKKKSK